jgi:lambda family phage minor tail protein L
MPKTLSPEVQAEVVKTQNAPINLYTIWVDDSVILYLAEWPTNVRFDGQLYLAAPLAHSTVKSSASDSIDQVQISISNVNREMASIALQYNGLRRKKIQVITVFENLLDNPDNKIIKFEGYVASCTFDQNTLTFTVTSVLDLQDIYVPRRIFHRVFCYWTYKGTECGYTGSLETCAKTLEGDDGCRVHENAARFGAFPGIASNRTLLR